MKYFEFLLQMKGNSYLLLYILETYTHCQWFIKCAIGNFSTECKYLNVMKLVVASGLKVNPTTALENLKIFLLR